MDSEINLAKFGFRVGERVALSDDDWSVVGNDIVVIDVEPVPGSTQCLVRSGNEVRTVGRSELRRI